MNPLGDIQDKGRDVHVTRGYQRRAGIRYPRPSLPQAAVWLCCREQYVPLTPFRVVIAGQSRCWTVCVSELRHSSARS